MKDPYFDRPEVSNSDLTSLKNYFNPTFEPADLERIFKFGSLVDAVITEPHKVDYFKLRVSDEQYTKEDFDIALAMQKSFNKDQMAVKLLAMSEMQKVSIKHGFPMEFEGFEFHLDVRCKWDFFGKNGMDICGDLKSTACTSEKQFKASIDYFDYCRQAAWYMDIEGKNNFIFIGVCKTYPFNIFKVPVKRGDAIYNEGKRRYQELAYNYWALFGDLKTA